MLLKTKLAASLLIVSALTTTNVLAGTEAGDGSVGGQIAITNSDSGDTTTILGSGSYFFTDAIEAGVAVAWIGNDTADTVLVGLQGAYNFNTDGNTVPFVGAGYTTTTLGDFDDTDFYTLFGGARQFVTEEVALRAELRYLGATDSDFDAFEQTTLTLGIEWFF